MKGWKWKGVQFRPTENVQSQFALSYLLIIAAVLILLNTYPLLACQTLVFQAKQSILTEAQMIASNLAELGELGESGVEQVMTLVGDSNLTRIVVTDSDAQLLYDTQESARPHRYALFQELTQALDGQDYEIKKGDLLITTGWMDSTCITPPSETTLSAVRQLCR